MKKKGFTFEQHQQLGAEVKEVYRTLLDFQIKIGNGCGVSCRASKFIESTIKKFGNVRSALDDIVCRDFPEKSDREVISCYYGGVANGRPAPMGSRDKASRPGLSEPGQDV